MSTDLYEAAESLLAPEPTEEITSEAEATDEGNLVEDQADEADLTDDDQEEAEEADPSDDDDAEDLSSEDDDEEITEDDEDTETDEAQLFTVIIDGKEEQWTLEQLKQSASGQGKISKGFQEAAAAKREADAAREEVEATKTKLAQYEQEILQAYNAVKSGANLTPPTPPSEDLLAKDPIGYLEADVRYKRELAEYQQNVQNMNRIAAQNQQRQAEAQRHFVDEQKRLLAERLPEFGNPETRETAAKKIVETAQRYNFTQEEMVGLTDMRYVLALNDAMKYHELMAQRKSAEKKVKQKPATQPIRAGAKKVAEPANTARKKAQERLKRTGSIDDAISLIFNS